jgi:YegS/Rv2252/BmrU family lipid kinase
LTPSKPDPPSAEGRSSASGVSGSLSGGLKRHIRFVINPIAGTRRKHHIPDKIGRHLDRRRYDYDIVYTQDRGHARELAEEAVAAGIDVLAIAGGDGSVNEAASGLLGSETALAILPLGSGNGLARHLGYSPWVKSTLDVINVGHEARLDVGMVNKKPFFSLVGIGFDAYVAHLFDKEKTRGLATYALASAMGLLRFKTFPFRLSSPVRNMEDQAFMLNVCNANQYGYNFRIAPDARLTDGHFDVVLTKAFPRWKAAKLVYDLALERHLEGRYTRRFQTDRLEVELDAPQLLQIDGEVHGTERLFQFSVRPQVLKALVNPQAHL